MPTYTLFKINIYEEKSILLNKVALDCKEIFLGAMLKKGTD